ncbi:MAG: GNAT family N-acetyltransferase [Alphaproteobacteria bacterium]|nr:GNAT family N-acetyltransferase [Alphaproteobacteria bacterium]
MTILPPPPSPQPVEITQYFFNNVYNVRLETPRLILREVTLQDINDFEDIRLSTSESPVTTNGIWIVYQDDPKGFVIDSVKQQNTNPRKFITLAMTLKDSPDKVIGFIKTTLEDMTLDGDTVYMNLSANTHANHQKEGYAKEAAFALIDWSFKIFGYDRVNATCHPDNQPSRKLLSALGFKEYGGIIFIEKYGYPRCKFEAKKEDFYKAKENFEANFLPKPPDYKSEETFKGSQPPI